MDGEPTQNYRETKNHSRYGMMVYNGSWNLNTPMARGQYDLMVTIHTLITSKKFKMLFSFDIPGEENEDE